MDALLCKDNKEPDVNESAFAILITLPVVAAGASMVLTHKFLMSGKAKGISIPKQKIIAGQIKKN